MLGANKPDNKKVLLQVRAQRSFGNLKNEGNMKNLSTLKNISLITAIFGGLSLYSFNCAPPAFKLANDDSLTLSSTGINSGLSLDVKIEAPQSLLTSEQVYESNMNLTGQKETVTNAQLQEFTRRSGSFSVSSDLSKINAPMLIALTSFNGEVCNGLVQKEQALAADQRQFFQNVNFGGAIGLLSSADYLAVVSRLSNSFIGRAPSSEEVNLFGQFRTDFIATIPAANVNQTAQTRALILSTCTALMSSFDVYTY